MLFSRVAPLLLPLLGLVVAEHNGPTFAPPLDLSSDESTIPKSWANLSRTLDAFLKDPSSLPETVTGLDNVTFSVGLWSLRDPSVTKLQYHYTAPEVANAENGTNEVDADSIYKVASVSKLITTYVGMIRLTDAQWHLPVTEIFPILAESPGAPFGGKDPAFAFEWEKITLWAVVSHLAGLPYNGLPAAGDLLFLDLQKQAQTNSSDSIFGLPPVPLSDLGPCSNVEDPYCAANLPDDFLGSLRTQTPSFLPYTSIGYSNAGFFFAAYAISALINIPVEEMYASTVFGPLGMNSSFAASPTAEEDVSRGVFVGDPVFGFLADAGITVGSGGLFSTLNDLNTLGTALLNSTLLPPNVTARWLKTGTNTASLSYDFGSPWEVIRYVQASGKVTNIYTKLGDSGPYGAIVALIPDYDAGFSMLNGASIPERGVAINGMLDFVADAVIPALEAQAQAEAVAKYAGTYKSTDPALNSSLVIGFNTTTLKHPIPALSVESWISNGTDLLAAVFGPDFRPRLIATIPSPTGRAQPGPRKVAFRMSEAVTQLPSYQSVVEAGIGPFSAFYTTNPDWFQIGKRLYGNVALDLIVFELDAEERVVGVDVPVARLSMKKEA